MKPFVGLLFYLSILAVSHCCLFLESPTHLCSCAVVLYTVPPPNLVTVTLHYFLTMPSATAKCGTMAPEWLVVARLLHKPFWSHGGTMVNFSQTQQKHGPSADPARPDLAQASCFGKNLPHPAV